MISRLWLLGLVLSVSAAHAQAINTFDWKTSGAVVLKGSVENVPFAMKAEMLKPGGDSIEMATSDARIVAKVVAYPGFVSIIVLRIGEDSAQMYLLEQKSANKFEQMNSRPIYGRAAQMPQDLQYSLDRFSALKNLNGKDPSFAFRTMVAYFEDYPDRKLDAFADDVERGVEVVRVVPKPDTKVTGGPEVRPLPQNPGNGLPDQAGNYPATPGEIGSVDPNRAPVPPESVPPQPKKKRRQQQPQPGDLDFFPPPPGMDPQWDAGNIDPFTGQPVRQKRRTNKQQQGNQRRTNQNWDGNFDDGRQQPRRQQGGWDPFAIFR